MIWIALILALVAYFWMVCDSPLFPGEHCPAHHQSS